MLDEGVLLQYFGAGMFCICFLNFGALPMSSYNGAVQGLC
jgi:hypothetical protein